MFKIKNYLVAVKEDLRPPFAEGNLPSATQKKLAHVLSRTLTHRQSFFPRTIRDWNRLPPQARTATEPEAFKEALQLCW